MRHLFRMRIVLAVLVLASSGGFAINRNCKLVIDALQKQHPKIVSSDTIAGLPWLNEKTTAAMPFGERSTWTLGFNTVGDLTAQFIIEPKDSSEAIEKLIVSSSAGKTEGDWSRKDFGKRIVFNLVIHDKDTRPDSTDTSHGGRRSFIENIVNGLPKSTRPGPGVESQATLAIRSHTKINNTPVAELEQKMRSEFLGPNESLLDLLAQDNEVVARNGLTHKQMAGPLKELIKQTPAGTHNEVEYSGQTYAVAVDTYRGIETSPFGGGSETLTKVSIKNRNNNESIEFWGSLPKMIEGHGFYGGRATDRRLAPEAILDVFPNLIREAFHLAVDLNSKQNISSQVSVPTKPAISEVAQLQTQVSPPPQAHSLFPTSGQPNHSSTLAILRSSEIAGIPVKELESDMRPGKLSNAGFLGRTEGLLEVLALDNETVLSNGLTHEQMAGPLELISSRVNSEATQELIIGGTKYKVTRATWRGSQESPFRDGTRTAVDYRVENTSNGAVIEYSGLLPVFIKNHGFYEGKETAYRLAPEKILEVFPWLRSSDTDLPTSRGAKH